MIYDTIKEIKYEGDTMKKTRKRYSILLIILIAIGMTVFFMIFQGRKNTPIVDVYLDNSNQQHIVTYGVNAAYIDGNNEKWKIATATIDESIGPNNRREYDWCKWQERT